MHDVKTHTPKKSDIASQNDRRSVTINSGDCNRAKEMKTETKQTREAAYVTKAGVAMLTPTKVRACTISASRGRQNAVSLIVKQ